MGWTTGIATYVVVWWLVIFMVLPWGNRPLDDTDIAKGHASGAPKRPRLLIKAAVNHRHFRGSMVDHLGRHRIWRHLVPAIGKACRRCPWYCDSAPRPPVPRALSRYRIRLSADRRGGGCFERLSLEIFQAGLSWLIVLKKREGMRAAFDGFDVDRVAAYGETDVARLLADAGIIRNRRKVAAIIENAKRIQALRESHGGFAAWIAANHPRDKDAWVKLFRKTFAFTGGEVVNEFLMSIGYLPGAHRPDCPVFDRIAPLHPAWSAESQEK